MTEQVSITEVQNAKSLDESNINFYVEINHPTYGWMPYTLHHDDPDQTIDNSVVRELIGDNFAAYVPPAQEELDAEAAGGVREERDYKLATEVDPLVTNPLRWADLTEAKQAEWTAYRTALLNITDQDGFPHTVTWPTKPT